MRATLFLLAATTAVAAPTIKPKHPPDGQRILGDWVQEALSNQGTPKVEGDGSTFRFRNDGSAAIVHDGGSETASKFSIDEAAKPRILTWITSVWDNTVWTCVYKFEGDRLLLAFVNPGVAPPTIIEPSKDLTIYYLKRTKQ